MPPLEIIYEVKDRKGKSATTSVKLGETETKARVQLFGVAWADVLDNLIEGIITGATCLLRINITGLINNTVTNDSDVEEVASAQFTSEDNTQVEVNIPAILETVVNNDTGDLDQAAPQVQAFLTMMEDGIAVTGGTIIPCDIGESGNLAMDYFRERSRNSGKRKKN